MALSENTRQPVVRMTRLIWRLVRCWKKSPLVESEKCFVLLCSDLPCFVSRRIANTKRITCKKPRIDIMNRMCARLRSVAVIEWLCKCLIWFLWWTPPDMFFREILLCPCPRMILTVNWVVWRLWEDDLAFLQLYSEEDRKTFSANNLLSSWC